MMVDTDDLVSAGQIAKRAGTVPSAVTNWRKRHEDFPAPVWQDGKQAAFLWWQVSAWLRHHGKTVLAG